MSSDLPDDAVAVRFGVMKIEELMESAKRYSLLDESEGRQGLSVYSIPGRTADEIAEEVGLPHTKIRATTIGTIRKAGFELRDPKASGHVTVLLPEHPVRDDFELFESLFGEPMPNPATKGQFDV